MNLSTYRPVLPTKGFRSTRVKVISAFIQNRYSFTALVLQLVIYFVLVVSLQVAGGAFQDDFSGASDEPSHYVTALMVRDYFAAGLPHGPMRFAEDFYIHYPKMAMGHWPPVGYVIFGIWMLVFGAGRTPALLLLALLTSACALLLFMAARRVMSPVAAHLIATALLLLPVVQMHNDMVMLEVPLMLLSLAAVLAFDRLLTNDSWANAGWCGLVGGAAIMTKGNGWALVLVPPIAVVLLRDLRRIAAPRMLFAAGVMGVICAPFTLWSMRMVKHGWDAESSNWKFAARAMPQFGLFMFSMVGVALAVCFLAGFGAKAIVPLWNKRLESFWAVMASYVASVWIFHVIVPTSVELRKVLAALPALLLFAGAGVDLLTRALPVGISLRKRQLVVTAAVSLAFIVFTFEIPRGYCPGFVRAVQFLLSKPELKEVGFFVSSTTDGEGRFIAEVASREIRPQHIVVRATKTLVRTNWQMSDYQLRSTAPAEVANVLNTLGIAILVLHNEPQQQTVMHHQLISAMLNQSPDWQKIYYDQPHCSRHARGEEIVVYSYRPDPFRKPSHVEIDLESKIGRTLRR